ncbi:MAG: hypothetical protein WCP21_22200, partial [Armatimonadota bacterium]
METGEPIGRESNGGRQDTSLSSYWKIALRYWWMLVLVVLSTTVVAYVFTSLKPVRYEATAKLLYGGTYTDFTQLSLELNGVNATLNSPALQSWARITFGHPLPDNRTFTVTAAPVSMTGSGEVLTDTLTPTRLVSVAVQAGSATLAANLANAYAGAFVERRTQEARAQAKISAKEIRSQIAALDASAGAGAGGTDFLASTRATLTQQLGQQEVIATTGNGGYALLAEAEVPTSPYAPRPNRSALLGLCVGLVAAGVVVIVLRRFGNRVGDDSEAATMLG